MQWTALVEDIDHVCCRYRLGQMQSALARSGVEVRLQPLPNSFWRRRQLFAALRGANVILQRRLLDSLSWRLLRRSVASVAYDFDDAVWLRDSYAPRGLQSYRRLNRFQRIVAESDVILAGNQFLADFSRQFNRRGAVTVAPTCVEPGRYPIAKHNRSTNVRLVWIGSSSTLRGLEQFRDVLDAVGEAMPHASLRLVCDRTLTLEKLRVEFCPWSEANEAATLADSDIGISWLPDDDWSRGKCGLKVLQYFAAGLPVVANPVGVHREMILQGDTGFLATTRQQWLDTIISLAESTLRRREIGTYARSLVERHYSVDSTVPKLIEALSIIAHKVVETAVSA
jgi:glycosyltransferase involved in cell wall biosynthesis